MDAPTSPSSRPILLLGPQRFQPMVRIALDRLGVSGPMAVVSAGWEEREMEDQELEEHVGIDLINTRLYWRTEEVFRRDPDLKAALYERHDRLRALRNLHRMRLSHELDAARALMVSVEDESLVAAERDSALEAVRTLDRHHGERIRQLHAEFDARWRPQERPALAREREELEKVLARADVLGIAGGHVAVLVNRLRLFDILDLLGDKPIVAWSAGAMTLTDRIVLFHDSPPQGFGNPEILEHGLEACHGVVALPHARRRLDLEDPVRVSLFARRFAPDACVALDDGASLHWDGARWIAGPGTRQLDPAGAVPEMAAP